MKRTQDFMGEVLKGALNIEIYWGRVEFAQERGQIYLHMFGVAKNKAYLNDFYKVKTSEDKAVIVNQYASK